MLKHHCIVVDCGVLQAKRPLLLGRNVTLLFSYTEVEPCVDFSWKVYTDDWKEIPSTARYVLNRQYIKRTLTIVNTTGNDERNYVVQCCDLKFSSVYSLKLSGKLGQKYIIITNCRAKMRL